MGKGFPDEVVRLEGMVSLDAGQAGSCQVVVARKRLVFGHIVVNNKLF